MNKTRSPILDIKFLALVGTIFCLSASAQLAPLPPMNLGIVAPSSISGFVPASGYYEWWNPDVNILTNINGLTNWTGANGSLATNVSSTTTLPKVQLSAFNGHNVISFAGVGVLTNPFPSSISQPIEIILMLSTGTTGNQYCFSDNVSFGAACYIGSDNGYGEYAGGLLAVGSNPATNNSIFTFLFNGASSQIWSNGASILTGNPGSASMTKFLIGSFPENGNWLGNEGDVVIYTNILSDATRQNVENGMRKKYGL